MSTLLPNDEELNFRKTHYKCVLDVLDGDICCAICNADLKKDIILKEDIMLHEIFLCLCCETCFKKLSYSQNGCIFCSLNVQLKTCEVCNNKMCERCMDNYCSMSKYQKTLKSCLSCSTNALWTHRSQADAVLKCFSFELDSRLILSGQDSLEKQNICEFVISTAQCNDFTPNDIYHFRVKYLWSLLKSKIELSFYEYQKLIQMKDTKQCIESFTKLCEFILKSTCAILLDFKCLFDDEIIKSFNRKIQSIIKSSVLFNVTENNCNKTWEIPCTSYNALNYRRNELLTDHESSNVPTPNCNVSLEKQNEKIIKQNLSSMVDDETVNLNIESNIKNNSVNDELTENSENHTVLKNIGKRVVKNFTDNDPFKGRYVFKMLDPDTMICDIIDNNELVGEIIDLSTESSSNINSIQESVWPKVYLTRCDQQDIDNKNKKKSEEFVGEPVNLSTESSSNINSIQENIWPKVYLTRCDQQDIDNKNKKKSEEFVGKPVNLSTESSSNINSIRESIWPKVYLTKCDQMDIDNKNEKKSKKKLVVVKANLTKCNYINIANKNEINTKSTKSIKKRKFQEKPNSKPTRSSKRTRNFLDKKV